MMLLEDIHGTVKGLILRLNLTALLLMHLLFINKLV